MQLHQYSGMYIKNFLQHSNADTDPHPQNHYAHHTIIVQLLHIYTTAPNYNKLCSATTAYVYNLYKTWSQHEGQVFRVHLGSSCRTFLIKDFTCYDKQAKPTFFHHVLSRWLLSECWTLAMISEGMRESVWHYASRGCFYHHYYYYHYNTDILLISTQNFPELTSKNLVKSGISSAAQL